MREAEDMIATEHWNLAVQRMYYPCFYIAPALLLSGGFKAQTHNGVVGQLGLNYVTKGLLTKDEDANKLFKMLEKQSPTVIDLFLGESGFEYITLSHENNIGGVSKKVIWVEAFVFMSW